MFAVFVCFAFLLIISGCGGQVSIGTHEMAEAEDVVRGYNDRAGHILVRNAFVVGTDVGHHLREGGNALLFVTFVNHGDADHLIGAESAVAESTSVSGGKISIPSGKPVQVGPGASKIILERLDRPVNNGDYLSVTLRFARAGKETFSVHVVPRTDAYADLPTPTPRQ